jgi:hypothetical protein
MQQPFAERVIAFGLARIEVLETFFVSPPATSRYSHVPQDSQITEETTAGRQSNVPLLHLVLAKQRINAARGSLPRSRPCGLVY